MSSGTPTANLGLMQLDILDDIVYSEINGSFQKIDNAIADLTITSTTRPTTGLYNGRLIFETDTNRVMRWNTTLNNWQLVFDYRTAITADNSVTITAFTNNFVGANGASDNPVVVKRNGVAMLNARVRQTAGFTGGAAFVLPAGFRPLQAIAAQRAYAGNAGNAAGPELIFTIGTDGTVTITRKDTATTPTWDANTWITVEVPGYLTDAI